MLADDLANEFLKPDNHPYLSELVSIVMDNAHSQDKNLHGLQKLIRQHIPPDSTTVWRGTKFTDDRAAHILSGEPFTPTKTGKSWRSWSSSQESAHNFIVPGRLPARAIAVVLEDVASPDDIIVDLSDENILETLEMLVEWAEYEMENEDEDTDVHTPLHFLLGGLDSALSSYIHAEKEVVLWSKPRTYTMCETITKVGFYNVAEIPTDAIEILRKRMVDESKEEFEYRLARGRRTQEPAYFYCNSWNELVLSFSHEVE